MVVLLPGREDQFLKQFSVVYRISFVLFECDSTRLDDVVCVSLDTYEISVNKAVMEIQLCPENIDSLLY